ARHPCTQPYRGQGGHSGPGGCREGWAKRPESAAAHSLVEYDRGGSPTCCGHRLSSEGPPTRGRALSGRRTQETAASAGLPGTPLVCSGDAVMRALHTAGRGRGCCTVPGLYGSEALTRRLECRLGACDGIQEVAASTHTGNVLVRFRLDRS